MFFLRIRAEYGVLKNTLKRIEQSDKLELHIVVTGTHLLRQYGYTVDEIRKDGFENLEIIEMLNVDDEEVRVPYEMGQITGKLADIFARIHPDILLLIGDRYEILAAASTAVAMHIPIAHISGGESTQGAMDEQIRHAITKMAHIHFPGADVYGRNIKNMGEEDWRIFNVGDPAIENIRNVEIRSREELEKSLSIDIDRNTLLITYHPVTLEKAHMEGYIDNLLNALKCHNGTQIITYPNSDDGSSLIIEKWKEYAKDNDKVCLVESLGIVRYLSVMHYCGAVVGNSSSAIIEAPFLKVPVVNIGNRQEGRLMADNIISCPNTEEAIADAIHKALSEAFQNKTKNTVSLYGDGATSEQITEVLESVELGEHLLKKKLEW